jgi:inosine/xanthosine triphosphatase
MKVLIATKNQGKIEGARKALLNYFDNVEIEGIPVESNVSEQPVNDEIYAGAKNRVKNLKEYCKQNNVVADLYLSIESGINNSLGRWMITNIAVIEDNNNFESYGTSPSFPVPDRLVQDIINTDLSKVMNKIFEKDDERHNRGGGIQLLTHNKISRIDLTEMAFIMALTKYINEDWK